MLALTGEVMRDETAVVKCVSMCVRLVCNNPSFVLVNCRSSSCIGNTVCTLSATPPLSLECLYIRHYTMGDFNFR